MPRPRAKTGVRSKLRQKATSPFLRGCVRDINVEIREAYGRVTATDRYWGTVPKILPKEAEEVFFKYRGRCAYCDARLSYLNKKTRYAACLHFYIPLNVKGEARKDNLIVVCRQCKHDYRSTKRLREDIVGLDSFADTCEALFRAVQEGSDYKTVQMIKERLNSRLEDVATCMRYTVKSDWVPDTIEMVQDGTNTVAEHLEEMANGNDVKEKVTRDIKQIVSTKQYKVIRNIDK